MTTQTGRAHLIYPTYERLQERLAQAEQEKLILHSHTETQLGDLGFQWEFRGVVTSSEPGKEYNTFAYYDTLSDRAYTHCECPAGEHQGICKHAAYLMKASAILDRRTAVRVMTPDEMLAYERLALLPDWK